MSAQGRYDKKHAGCKTAKYCIPWYQGILDPAKGDKPAEERCMDPIADEDEPTGPFVQVFPSGRKPDKPYTIIEDQGHNYTYRWQVRISDGTEFNKFSSSDYPTPADLFKRLDEDGTWPKPYRILVGV